MPAGRPTTWSKALEKKAWEYANGKWQEQGDRTPSVVGLCGYINRSRRVIYKWAEEPDKQFMHILDSISEKQEAELLKNGLSGDFNSTITKLMLTKHGYHDKQDQTLAGPGGGAVKTDNKFTIEIVKPNAKSSDS